MKKKQLIALAATLALSLSAAPLAGCGQQGGGGQAGGSAQEAEPQYADEAFIKDLAKGLEARWKLPDIPATASSAEEEEAYRKAVNAELDIIKDYTSATFEDSKLQEKAIQYINLLKDQLEALKFTQVDYVKYSDLWKKAYDERSKMLVDFADNYGLTVSSEYAETLADMRVNATTVSEKEDKQAKIDALCANVVFEKASDDPYDTEYVAIVENNTGFDIKTYTADVILLDADGVNVNTQYVSVNSWKNGQKAKLQIYPYNVEFVSTEVNVTYWEEG